MTEIYSTAKVCPIDFPDCNLDEEGLSLEPGKVYVVYILKRLLKL